jgi:hypothetical protein
MTVSSKLFTAILAMDSYNRGYNARVGDPHTGLTGTAIGNALVSASLADENTAFFAQAYTISGGGVAGLTNGQEAISYRGADNIFGSSGTNGDLVAGWSLGFGFPATAQSSLALQFYNSVTHQTPLDGPTPGVILTGLSLGGGRAGVKRSLDIIARMLSVFDRFCWRQNVLAASVALSAFFTWCLPAEAEKFSIKCVFLYEYYVSFDTEVRRAVYENTLTGSTMKGTIGFIRDNEIAFDLLIAAKPKFELVWNETTKKLTWLGIKGDESRQGQTNDCVRAALRPLLSDYKNIAPME